ncbi:hypothetical protein HAHE_41310 [Haloferula helveola]|uniref:BON domain-containing protein n=1 Tax=Haloferula helveola TaxID=490095 RepID=A0ABN6H9R9_9BACT|nr:hypothetical protein HAHE_41310 [Haloferula helveola]
MKSSRLALAVFATIGMTLHPLQASPSADIEDSSSSADTLRAFLTQSGRVDGANLSIDVATHIATLSGEVDNLDQAEFVATSALRIDGIYGVVQGISVRPVLDGVDAAAKQAVGAAPELKHLELTVAVDDGGTATVSGTVGCIDDAEVAREHLSRVNGVRRIVLKTTIDPLLFRSDDAVADQVRLYQLDDPLLALLPLEYHFRDGVMTIEGRVGSVEEKERVILSSMVSGVMSCNSDKVVIDPALAMDGMSEKFYQPSDVAEAFRRVVKADPRLVGSKLHGEFERGRFVIRGDVKEAAAKEAAIRDARALPGVMQVEDRMRIVRSELSAR